MKGARRIIGAAIKSFGRLDILVNNAGGIRSATIVKMTEEQWDSVIGVQLKGVFNCTSVAVKQMLKQGRGGRIITMAGAAGVRGMYANANHAASKGAVLAATFSWSLELERYGITVNAVRAGVRTKTSAPLAQEVRKQLAALGRRGPGTDRELGFFEPAEAAPIVVWLASDEAAHVTGQFIGIDGPKLVVWSLAQPLRTLYMFPQWTPELIQEHFKPVIAESAQRSLGVLEVVPSLGHLTPEIQKGVEKSAARKIGK
ncbi:MAG: SDR family oxidoreductase [Chloroflexi bacterium]|nr:SDR family oxidoreductase [Chloroflexota bacterium]